MPEGVLPSVCSDVCGAYIRTSLSFDRPGSGNSGMAWYIVDSKGTAPEVVGGGMRRNHL